MIMIGPDQLQVSHSSLMIDRWRGGACSDPVRSSDRVRYLSVRSTEDSRRPYRTYTDLTLRSSRVLVLLRSAVQVHAKVMLYLYTEYCGLAGNRHMLARKLALHVASS